MHRGDLDLRGFANARDLGGLPVAGGGTTRTGVLLRADLPRDPDPDELAGLAATGLVVVDLRDDVEVAQTPSPFAIGGARVVRVPVFDGSAADVVADGANLAALYGRLVATRGPAFAAVAAEAADSPGPTLVHCTAGKDRTGVAVALVLAAVGVPRQVVVEDYARTGERLAGPWLERRLSELSALHGRDLSAHAELLGGSPRAALDRALDQVDQGWGSAAGYLHAHGLRSDGLDRLRDRLVAA